MIRLDFPLPDTPVTQIKQPNGKRAVTFFKLFPVAPFSTIALPLPCRRFSGTDISCLPFKYAAVNVSDFNISEGVPANTTFPPNRPALGPKSIT